MLGEQVWPIRTMFVLGEQVCCGKGYDTNTMPLCWVSRCAAAKASFRCCFRSLAPSQLSSHYNMMLLSFLGANPVKLTCIDLVSGTLQHRAPCYRGY